MSILSKIKYLLLMVFILIPGHILSVESDIHDLIRLLKKTPVEKFPNESMELKEGVIICTGKSKVAVENNRAANLILKGRYKSAEKILLKSIKFASLFFPFRYNLGVCYLSMNKLQNARLHFTKAQQVFPEYSKTYLMIGYIFQRQNIDSKAVEYFREALKRNKKELETFILIGNIYFKRNQFEMANKYYEATLQLHPRFPNGLLGQAKILYKKGKYIQSIVLMKSIDTKEKYDISLHYYFAEASFKLRDYKSAILHYSKLLKFKNDRFFLTNSRALIEHKLNISRRFVER